MLVVSTGYVDIGLTLLQAYSFMDVDGTNISFVRSARLLKLTKVLPVLRLFEVLAPLRRMMLSVIETMASLFWCLSMLAFILYVFALIFMTGVHGYLVHV